MSDPYLPPGTTDEDIDRQVEDADDYDDPRDRLDEENEHERPTVEDVEDICSEFDEMYEIGHIEKEIY